MPTDAQKLVLLYLKRADLQPPLGHPGGSCYFQRRIRDDVRNEKVQDFLVNKHQDGPKVDWKDMEEDAIYRKDMDIGPVGQTLVEVILVPHTQRRMDIRSITIPEIKKGLYEFMSLIHKEKRDGDSRLEKQLLSRKDFEWKGAKIKFWLRGLNHWMGKNKKGKPQLKVKLQVRTVMPFPFKHPNPVPEPNCPHFKKEDWEGYAKEYPEHGFERLFPKRVAARFAALRQDPIPGYQTYVTQRSEEGLPHPLRKAAKVPVETPNGSAMLIPMEGGRVIRPSQFSIPLARAKRRQGVGTRLFADVAEQAREHFPQAKTFRAYAASEGVVEFWQAQGFRVVDPNGPLGSTVMERPVRQGRTAALVAGEGASNFRLALRYALLRQAPTPGVQTYVTQRSEEGLPNDVADGSPSALPLPGSATPGGAGRVIPQFSFNVPGPGSDITPRTLGVPGEQYGHPSNNTYNTVTRRIIESSIDEENPLDEEEAYRPKWRPGKYQRKSRGRTKHKRQMNYRKNKAKRKMQSKRWRKINSRKPAYKQWQKRRRGMNRKRRVASTLRVANAYMQRMGSVLTVPDIAFQIGPEMIPGYVHSISPMSGMVTFTLDATNVSQLDSMPVELFLRMAVFTSDADIEAFFDLVDVEIGPTAYRDLDEKLVRQCARRYDRDPDSDSFKEDCFGLSGEYDLGSTSADQMDSIVQAVALGYVEGGLGRDLNMNEGATVRSIQDADDPEVPDQYDPHLVYGEVPS